MHAATPRHATPRHAILLWGISLTLSACLTRAEKGEDVPFGRQSSALQPGVDISTDSLGTVLSPTSATIVESNRHADEQFHLVARIQIHPGALFEIYEPAPGFIAYSGAGSAEGALQDVTAVSLRGKSLADVWELVSVEPMPTDVAAAAERQLARWAEAGVDPTSSVAHETLGQNEAGGVVGGTPANLSSGGVATMSGGFCDTDYFTEPWPGYLWGIPGSCVSGFDQTICLDNNFVSAWAYNYETFEGYTNVCSAQGTVVLSVKWEETESNWSVEQNHWRWYSNSDVACASLYNDCPYFRSRINQVDAGDRFHFRFFVDEYGW